MQVARVALPLGKDLQMRRTKSSVDHVAYPVHPTLQYHPTLLWSSRVIAFTGSIEQPYLQLLYVELDVGGTACLHLWQKNVLVRFGKSTFKT